MPLNSQAQAESSKLSEAAQERIKRLCEIADAEGSNPIHISDLNKVLTSPDWKKLAQDVLGKDSVFEIGTFSELQQLFASDTFYTLMDPSGFINSLFNTHYKNLLIDEGQTGNATIDKVKKKSLAPQRPKKSGELPSSPLPTKDTLTEDECDEINACKIKDLLQSAHNIILHGAPGTGKTYLAKQVAKEMGAQVKMVQFHPSYDYSDFMEGLRPFRDTSSSTIGFERKDGAFKKFCKDAINSKDEDFVFIIDEINRGEIAKILGECMFSIDPGYVGKEGKIETQYQGLIEDAEDDPFKDGFYRPSNVFIIGTMNDIDRGVESMDLAMRRRFQFIEVKADDTQDSIFNEIKENDVRAEAKQRMDSLNKVIRDTPELGEDYCIGASYFLKLKYFAGEDKWEKLWNLHLKGLLKEYVRGLEDTNLMHMFKEAYDLKGSSSDVKEE